MIIKKIQKNIEIIELNKSGLNTNGYLIWKKKSFPVYG